MTPETDADVEVAVVGAGIAGAGAAYRAGLEGAGVTVFERADAVGGRMATRHRDGCTYDYAASYVKATGDERETLLRRVGDAVVAADGPVWTFDGAGTISTGRPDQDAKLTGRDGLSALVEALCEAASARVRTGTTVTGLTRLADGWRVRTETDSTTARAVVVTPPAGETATLLRTAASPPPGCEALATAAARVPYRTIDVAVLHYPFELDRPWYALVNTDRDHDIGWLAREACKPGHVPAGESLLVVQTSPVWSMALADRSPDAVVAAVAERTATLLDDDRLRDPDWTDHARFEWALPDRPVEPGVVERAARANLYVAGDWVAGAGRTYAALSTGLDAGLRAATASGSEASADRSSS